VNHVLTYAFGGEQGSTDNPYAADFVSKWIRAKYGVDLTVDYIRSKSVRELHDEMCAYQEELTRGPKLEKEIDDIIKAGATPSEQLKIFNNRFSLNLTDEIFKPEGLPPAIRALIGEKAKETRSGSSPMDTKTILMNVAKGHLRRELTDLEQFVLIQIFDLAWKDHLYAMDMLKSGIGLQSFAEQDPRILYKKEGFEFFQQMLAGIRDKVTDQIFRAKLMGEAKRTSNYRETAAVHADAGGYGVSENMQSSGGGNGEVATATTVKTIVNEKPKVGRNDDCPCGSGKKYKKCCGAGVA
jgi:preprotein translocase subunit SecA